MRTYKPTYTGDADVRREFEAIRKAATRSEPFLQLDILHAEPEKRQAGMIVYADGTDWDPGSGEGLYRCNSALLWGFIG